MAANKEVNNGLLTNHDFVFALDADDHAGEATALQRERDELDDMYAELMTQFTATRDNAAQYDDHNLYDGPAIDDDAFVNDGPDEAHPEAPQEQQEKTSAGSFGTGGIVDREIAFNMAKGILVAHYLMGVPFELAHRTMNPYVLTNCSVPGCRNRTSGIRFYCDKCTQAYPWCGKLSMQQMMTDYLHMAARFSLARTGDESDGAPP